MKLGSLRLFKKLLISVFKSDYETGQSGIIQKAINFCFLEALRSEA